VPSRNATSASSSAALIREPKSSGIAEKYVAGPAGYGSTIFARSAAAS
jgi:hypothetical protein